MGLLAINTPVIAAKYWASSPENQFVQVNKYDPLYDHRGENDENGPAI